MSIGRGTNNIFDVRTLLKKDLVKRGLRFGLVSLGYCNITLPKGGMCWKIRPLYFYVFVYHNFITLPLYKKRWILLLCRIATAQICLALGWPGIGYAGCNSWESRSKGLKRSQIPDEQAWILGCRLARITQRFEYKQIWNGALGLSWFNLLGRWTHVFRISERTRFSRVLKLLRICSCPFLFRQLTRAMYFGRCQAFTLGCDSSWSSGRAQGQPHEEKMLFFRI